MLFIKVSGSGYGMPSLELLKEAKEAGWETSTPLSNKETPLYLALDKGKYEIADFLIENGADISERLEGFIKISPLQKVFWDRRKEVDLEKLKWILARKADPNAEPDYRYEYPLTMAVQRGNVEVVKLLLNAGADPEKRVNNIDGQSGNIAQYALEVGEPEMQKLF